MFNDKEYTWENIEYNQKIKKYAQCALMFEQMIFSSSMDRNARTESIMGGNPRPLIEIGTTDVILICFCCKSIFLETLKASNIATKTCVLR